MINLNTLSAGLGHKSLQQALLISAVLFALSTQANTNTQVRSVLYYQKEFRYLYYQELLNRILQITEGEFESASANPFSPNSPEIPEERGLALLTQEHIDVVFLSTSNEREEQFRAIRVPLVKGLLGLRLLMIESSSQPHFDEINTLEELIDQATIGSNPQWSDHWIHGAHGFQLRKSVSYEGLFKMLAHGQVHFLSRGFNEIWSELEHFKMESPTLTVENHLALYFHYPVYFFVRKNDETLAQRLTLGLSRMSESGEMDALFDKYFGEHLSRAKLAERKIFFLYNPQLPADTPKLMMSWWPNEQVPPDNQLLAPFDN